jgi:hypothetical protein
MARRVTQGNSRGRTLLDGAEYEEESGREAREGGRSEEDS